MIPLDNIDFSKNIENFLNEYMINPDPILLGLQKLVKLSLGFYLQPQIGIVVTYILPLHILCFMFHFYISTY